MTDGTVKEVKLTLGLNDGDFYVVTDGLTAGDQIVVKGNSNLVNGTAVTVIAVDGVEQDLNLKAADDADNTKNSEDTESADGKQSDTPVEDTK